MTDERIGMVCFLCGTVATEADGVVAMCTHDPLFYRPAGWEPPAVDEATYAFTRFVASLPVPTRQEMEEWLASVDEPQPNDNPPTETWNR